MAHIADVARPNVKLPSVVRSGTLSILNDMYIPMAKIPYSRPSCKEPRNSVITNLRKTRAAAMGSPV